MQRATKRTEAWIRQARELSDAAVDDVLREAGHGTLSVATDAGVHSRPMSFGYDGERLYFQLATSPRRRRSPFSSARGPAELVVAAVHDVDDWHSVVVRGEMEPVAAADEPRAFEALADNAFVPQNALGFGECRDFELAGMRVETVAGRGGPASEHLDDGARLFE